MCIYIYIDISIYRLCPRGAGRSVPRRLGRGDLGGPSGPHAVIVQHIYIYIYVIIYKYIHK